MRDQRGQHAEPRLLVDHAVEAFIGEPAAVSPLLVLVFVIARSGEMNEDGGEQLPDAERQAHRPGRQRVRVAREGEAGETRAEIPHADHEQRRRQHPARREHADAQHDLPEARQHPQALRRVAHDDDGEERAGDAGGKSCSAAGWIISSARPECTRRDALSRRRRR